MGTRALYSDTTGEANTAIGPNAMYYNTSGSNNTSIGSWAGPASGSTNLDNTTAIGNGTTVSASNTIHIGNTAITEIAGQVGWSTYSDKRFKKEVEENVHGLDFIMKLKPVTYHWDINKLNHFLGTDKRENNKVEAQQACMRQEQKTYTGFLAQDVEKAAQSINYDFSGVVHPQNARSIYSVRYAEFVVPLVKAVQELNGQNKQLFEKVNGQQHIIEKQNSIIKQLQADIELIKKQLQKDN